MRTDEIVVPETDPPVRVRVYPAASGAAAAGVSLLWMHGGAFIGGSLDMPEADAVCSALADSGVTCVGVDYRLVPGFGRRRAQKAPDAVRYPLPLDDCERAWWWSRRDAGTWGVDPERMYVGGASAGGALAATLALRLTRAGSAPRGVVLAYPLLHATLPPASPRLRRALRGFRRLGTFSTSAVRWMTTNYVGRANLDRLPEALPGGGDLTGFPPTLVVNSERDSLRASGEAFADELRAHGSQVRVRCEPGTSHGHLNRPAKPAFGRTITAIADWLVQDDRERPSGP